MRCPERTPFMRVAGAIGTGMLTVPLTACGTEVVPTPQKDECAFTVVSQNRFKVSAAGGYGASVRAKPSIEAEKIGSYAGNDTIKAIGYVVTKEAAYPTNDEAIDGDHWVITRTINGHKGYISDAGIRADITKNDPTGLSEDFGPLVDFDALPADCNLSAK